MTIGADTTRYGAMETRQELDCSERKTRELEMQMETLAGVRAGSPTPDGEWRTIDSHPLDSGVFLVGCRTIGHPVSADP